MTVDEILATGKYTDRRWRKWRHIHKDGRWFHEPDGLWFKDGKKVIKMMRTEQMRLLIERDLHRDECMGLGICSDHPAWIVSRGYNEDGAPGWEILRPHKNQGRLLDLTHADAMSAARALAVGE